MPISEELVNYKVEYKLFKVVQNLQHDLLTLLNIVLDGQVFLEDQEAIEVAYKELFNRILQAVLDNPELSNNKLIKDKKTLRSIQPFNINR